MGVSRLHISATFFFTVSPKFEERHWYMQRYVATS